MPAVRKTRRSLDANMMDRSLVPPKLRKDSTVRSELDLRRELNKNNSDCSFLTKSTSSLKAKKMLRSSFKNLAKIFDRSSLSQTAPKTSTPAFCRKNRLFHSMSVKMRQPSVEQSSRVILRRAEQELCSGIIIWEENINEVLVN